MVARGSCICRGAMPGIGPSRISAMRSYSRFKRSRRKLRWCHHQHNACACVQTTEQARVAVWLTGGALVCRAGIARVAPQRCDGVIGACGSSRTRRRDRSGRRITTSAKSRRSRRRWARRCSECWRPRMSLAAKRRRRGRQSRCGSLCPLPRENSPGCFVCTLCAVVEEVLMG